MPLDDPLIASFVQKGQVAPALEDVVSTYRRWLYLPDAGPLLVLLATVLANRQPGDPVWLLIVGASGGGKTELLGGISALADVHPVATLTEAGLLSGTANRERAPDAKGGLLREVGEYGILALKDFGSVLSMSRETRGPVLAALREIYDGAWTRRLGVDGGRKLEWSGKLGLVGGCVSSIDRHHGVMASLGERFTLYRLATEDANEQARRSLQHAGRETEMRKEMRSVVARFFEALPAPGPTPLSAQDTERLVALSTLVARARSPVERDAYGAREIELIPDPEAPGRLVGVLARLLAGLRGIGVEEDESWRLVTKTGLDSMPAQRRDVLEHLLSAEEQNTTDVATALGYPTTTARRILEDLTAHAVLRRFDPGEGHAHIWRPDPWSIERFARATGTSARGDMPGEPSPNGKVSELFPEDPA